MSDSTAIKPFKYQPPAAFGSSEEINGIIERMEALVPVSLGDNERGNNALVKALDNAYLKAAQLSAFYRLIPGIDVHLIRFGNSFVVDTGVESWKKAADRYCSLHGITYHAHYEAMSVEELKARRGKDFDSEDCGYVCYIWRSDKVQVYEMFGGKSALTQGHGHWAMKAKYDKYKREWASDQIPAQRTKFDVAKRRALKAALKAEFSLDSLLAAAPNEIASQLQWLDKDATRAVQDRAVMQRPHVGVDENGFVVEDAPARGSMPVDESGFRHVGSTLAGDADWEEEGDWYDPDEADMEPDEDNYDEEAPDNPFVDETPQAEHDLRALSERLAGEALTLKTWAKQYHADSKGEASKEDYWALSGVLDNLLGKGNHNLILGVLLGRPVSTANRPGEKLTRYLFEFVNDKLPQLDEHGNKVKTAKGRIVYNKNPRYNQKFVDAILEAWRQITEPPVAPPDAPEDATNQPVLPF